MRNEARLALAVGVFFFAAQLALPGAAWARGARSAPLEVQRGAVTTLPERFDTSPPLWLMPRVVESRSRAGHEPLPVPKRSRPEGPVEDPVLQATPPWIRIPGVGVNFNGVGQGFSGPGGGFTVSSAPPDTNGEVGPNHYFQVVNTSFAVFDKAGTPVYGPAPISSMWAGFGGPCETENDGDPVVLYDQLADRWFVTQFSLPNFPSGPFYQCIAVSTSGSPTGSYSRYAYSFANLPDYGKFGMWPDAYYGTFNMFRGGALSWMGANFCAFDRAKMLAGQVATMQCFQQGTNIGGVLPADLDGPTPPAAGIPNFLATFDISPDIIQFWHFHVDWAVPGNSTITRLPDIPVGPINLACGDAGECVPQLGTTQLLDTLGDRLMFRMAYRQFSSHGSLVLNHTVDVVGPPARTGIRWYELRDVDTTPTLHQQGTYSPDTAFRWMGALAMDRMGNIGMGFSISSNTTHPGINYSGRLVSDPLGTMGQGENTIITGNGSQRSSTQALSRWGDYSDLTVDPDDDCTFWFTTEYIPTDGVFNWSTRIGSFRFDNCPPNQFSMSVTPPSQTVTAGDSANYTVSTAVVQGAPETVTLSVSGLPAGVTASFSPPTVLAGESSTLTLSTTAATPSAVASFTVAGVAPSVRHSSAAQITILGNDFSIAVSPASQTINSGDTAAYTVTTALVSGTPGTITLSISNLPAGITASFSPSTVLPGESSTLTLTTTTGTPGANTFFTVTGTTPSISRGATARIIVASDFSLAVSPASQSVSSSSSVNYTVSTTRTSGSAQSIVLSVSGLPAGVTGSFSPSVVVAGGSSTLRLNASAGAQGATATFTVRGSAPSSAHSATSDVTVLNDFSIAVSPASRSVRSGSSATYTVSTARTSGTAEAVDLSISGLPAGVIGSFTPATVTAGQSSTLTLTADAGAPGVTATTFTVTGTATSATHGATAQVIVPNDFSLAVSPASQSVRSGASITYTVATAPTSGTAETITLSVSGLPAGVSGAFNPATVNPGESSTLTLTADAGAQAATATFTVTGTAASATHTATADVTVASDFSIAISPTGRAVTAGASASYTVDTARTSGTAEAITLSVSGLPAGVSGAFSPATVTAGQSSTFTVTATAAAVGGTTSFRVTGVSASASREATAEVSVLNDFSIAVIPASQSLRSGTSITISVATAITSGSEEMIDLAVSGLPAGVSSVFSPATVRAGTPSALTLTADPGAPGVTAIFTVTGVASSATHSATAELKIPNDFSIALAPNSSRIPAGGSVTFTITSALASGTGEPIALTMSALPAGVTGSFAPASISPGESSVLTLSAAADTADATANLTVTGTTASATHDAGAALTAAARPTVAISAPAASATVSGSVTLTAAATVSAHSTLDRIELYVDDVLVGTASGSPGSVTWDSSGVRNGAHTVTAKAFDALDGVGTSSPVSISVQNAISPPVVAITTPSDGTKVSGLVMVTATATPAQWATITKLELYVDDVLLATSATSPASGTWDTTTVAKGSHVLTARGYDDAGGVTTSAAVTVSVDNTKPGCGCGAEGSGAQAAGALAMLGIARLLAARRRRAG